MTGGEARHAPQWLELAGAHNVRDLAGLPAADGRRVRPGVLLRGDHLDDVTDADLAVLRDAVGLRAVVDLRTDREAPEPRPWIESLGVARLHLPLEGVRMHRHAAKRRAEAIAPSNAC